MSTLALVFHSLRKKKRKYHENPKVQGVNRLRSHTITGSFQSESEARRNVCQIEASPFVENIGGLWSFRLFKTVDEALAAVHNAPPQDCDLIEVPGHWQLQGFSDQPIYTNIKYIIPCDPPNVPAVNPSGYYEHTFRVSDTWSGRRLIISFGGVDNAFYLWLNGNFIGFSKDSRLDSEFDITDVVSVGAVQNTLQVVVPRFSDGYYLEDQDMWNLSGIYRDVYLISYPKPVHISDFRYAIEIFVSCHDILLDGDWKWIIFLITLMFL